MRGRETASFLARAFPAFRYRDYRLLLSGMFVSLTGFWAFIVTQAWMALEITGSNTWVGIVSSALSLPFLFTSLLAGVLADRVDRKRLMLLIRAAVVALMVVEAVLAAAGLIDRYVLVAFGLGLGILTSLDIPTRQSLVADLVPQEHVGNAVAIQNSSFNLTWILGPATGATLLAVAGPAWSFAVTAAGNAILVVLVLMMRIPPREHHADASILSQLREGLGYVVHAEVVRWLLVIALFVAVLGDSYRVLLPSMARDVFGAGEGAYGMLVAMAGVGALAGSLSMAVALGRRRKAPLVLAGPAVYGVGLIALSQSPALPTAAALLVVVGAASAVHFTTNSTIILTTTPERLRGRAMSVVTLVWGLTPLGSLIAGLLADHMGVRSAIAINASIALAAAVLVFSTRRALRAL